MSGDYQLVQLKNGRCTLYSAAYGEKLHPGLGPQAEAEALYVRQLRIPERLAAEPGEWVLWDVGLGGAANALAVLDAASGIAGRLRLVSFDNSAEPLRVALQHAGALGYLAGHEGRLEQLLRSGRSRFRHGRLEVDWEFRLGDFPAGLQARPAAPAAGHASDAPRAIFYDAFSPATNPAMWTLPLFRDLFRALDPSRPCALTTYSRSTMLRTTLLLAGFRVGVGQSTGFKEETTVAANVPDLIAEPLGARWLERALRSDSAEPLTEPVYRRAPLLPATAAALRGHPQFAPA